MITTVNISVAKDATKKVYTATEPCRVVLVRVAQSLSIKINATASSSDSDFGLNNSYMATMSNNSGLFGRNVTSIGDVISFDLEKGDYISMNYYPYASLTYTGTLYVYTR